MPLLIFWVISQSEQAPCYHVQNQISTNALYDGLIFFKQFYINFKRSHFKLEYGK